MHAMLMERCLESYNKRDCEPWMEHPRKPLIGAKILQNSLTHAEL